MDQKRFGKRSVIGLIIIIVGVLLFLGTMKIIDSQEIFSKGWPAILIVIGLFSFFDNSTSKIFGSILIILGVFYQLKVLDLAFEHTEIWMFIWPSIIIIVGFWLIFPKRSRNIDSDALNNTAIFSGGDINITSKSFSGGEVSAIFGGFDVDLRDADIPVNEPAVIDIFVAFGGIDIKVPEHWVVDVKAIPLFGGWDNKHKPSKMAVDSNTKHLVVKGLILFGGLDIK